MNANINRASQMPMCETQQWMEALQYKAVALMASNLISGQTIFLKDLMHNITAMLQPSVS